MNLTNFTYPAPATGTSRNVTVSEAVGHNGMVFHIMNRGGLTITSVQVDGVAATPEDSESNPSLYQWCYSFVLPAGQSWTIAPVIQITISSGAEYLNVAGTCGDSVDPADPFDRVAKHNVSSGSQESITILGSYSAGDHFVGVCSRYAASETVNYNLAGGVDTPDNSSGDNIAFNAAYHTATGPGSDFLMEWLATAGSRRMVLIGGWLKEGTAAPGAPVIGSVTAAHDTEADIPIVSAGSGADDHALFTSTVGPSGPWSQNGPSLGATPSGTITATGLTPDKAYWFTLRASNAGGSTDSNVETTDTAPARPTGMATSSPLRTSLDYTPSGGDVGTTDVWTEVQLQLRQALPTLELALRAHTYSGTGNWLDESGNGYVATPVGSPTWDGVRWTLNGTNQSFTIPDAVGLNFGDGDDFTLIVYASCAIISPSNHHRLAGKSDRYYLNNHGNNPYGRAVVRGNTSGTSSSDTPDIVAGRPSSFVLRRDWDNRRIRSWLNGQPGADNNDGTVGGFSNTEPFAIGAQWVGGTPTLHFQGDIYGVALARGLLTTAEMEVVSLYLLGLTPAWGDSKDHPYDVVYPQTAVNLHEGATYAFKARNYRLGGWKSGWSPEALGSTLAEGAGTLTAPASMRIAVNGEVTAPASMRISPNGEVTVPSSMRIRGLGGVLSAPASMRIALPEVVPQLGVGVPMTPN